MEPAVKRIIETYVRLNNRGAIEDLLIHRRRLVINLRARLTYDVSRPLAQIEEEIAIILAALERVAPLDQSMATRSLMMSSAAS
jgi:hypothetical protein